MSLRSRHRLARIACALLMFLFFAQAALAASGCLMPGSGLAKALAAAEKSGCSGEGSMNLNLCLAHCNSDSQSLDTGELPVSTLPSSVVLVVPPVGCPERLTLAVAVVCVERTSEPPIPIRFCSFLI
jgi:hypothetical protein